MYVYKRNDRWYCQFTVLNELKKRVKRTCFVCSTNKSKTEAKRLAEQVRLSYEINLNKIEPCNIPVSDVVLEFIERPEADYSITTLHSYRSYFKNHIAHNMYNLTISELKNMQALINILLKKGLSPKTCRHIRGMLAATIRYAYNMGYIENLPHIDVRIPSKGQKNIHIMSRNQVKLFMAYVDKSKHKTALLTMFYTMARRGEVCGLQYGDIDFDKKILYISRALNKVDGIMQIKPPKNGKKREILMPEELIKILKEYTAMKKWNKEEFLFKSENLDYLSPNALYHALGLIARQIKEDTGEQIPTGLHSIRHLVISELIANGVPVELVSKTAGHSSVAITTQIYTHVKTYMQEPLKETLDKIIPKTQS